MNRPTPMTEYRTVTTPAIKRPPVDAKPASRMGAIANLVKAGHSPIAAMIMLERRDHRQALPPQIKDTGGKGATRPARRVKLHDAVFALLTTEWRRIDPAMCNAVTAKIGTVRDAMRRLEDQGRIECRRVSSRLEWRVVG